MYTTHSSPNRAQTVAVQRRADGTGSAMILRFPILSAISACLVFVDLVGAVVVQSSP